MLREFHALTMRLDTDSPGQVRRARWRLVRDGDALAGVDSLGRYSRSESRVKAEARMPDGTATIANPQINSTLVKILPPVVMG